MPAFEPLFRKQVFRRDHNGRSEADPLGGTAVERPVCLVHDSHEDSAIRAHDELGKPVRALAVAAEFALIRHVNMQGSSGVGNPRSSVFAAEIAVAGTRTDAFRGSGSFGLETNHATVATTADCSIHRQAPLLACRQGDERAAEHEDKHFM